MRRIVLALGLLMMPCVAHAEEMVIDGPQGPLKGTLMMPADVSEPPTAIIIPGSGPTDRDGNSPLGIRAASLRLLAEALADQGIATLRIDKRGMFGSAAAIADPNAVSLSDYAEDVRQWAAAARARTGSSCIWLIGHSEGGLVGLAAAQDTRDLCGLVLVASAGRPLGAVIKEQLAANPANGFLLEAANNALDELAAGRRVDVEGMHPALLGLFNPAVQGFLMTTLPIDPAQLAASADLPILVVQGDADIQVSIEDARLLAAAAPGSTLAILPGVNHVLKQVENTSHAANVAAYANPDLPLAQGAASSIADFVKG